ncbi:MAG: hypothetical protein ACRDOY_01690 [Nocardioidaceae bacterium]
MTTPALPTMPAEPRVTWGQTVLTLASTAGLFLVGGTVCAAVWAAVVDPPTYPGTLPMFAGRAVPDAQGMYRTFNVDATFLLVALVGALALGIACGAIFRRYGVLTVLAVLLGSALGYLTMRHFGMGLGPEALVAQARGAGAQTTLLGPLRVQATGVYFAWPIGALVGAMASLWAFAPAAKALPGGRVVR